MWQLVWIFSGSQHSELQKFSSQRHRSRIFWHTWQHYRNYDNTSLTAKHPSLNEMIERKKKPIQKKKMGGKSEFKFTSAVSCSQIRLKTRSADKLVDAQNSTLVSLWFTNCDVTKQQRRKQKKKYLHFRSPKNL